ncbi:DNA N-6-adenine-methyltransferase [Nocardia noduli]|uniref:DNA N-6-adenine-methyltransferase n=1 Tax=Nocardia noduli TaxID=2815722 RepID=UPI0027E01F2E|nr:DNA N-6-adenine-methyltransferase [Nocardia noduli]
MWLTPPGLLDKLGPFDLDPCAHSPRPWPTAARHIAPPEDGLTANWVGRVWCNPPYGREVGVWLSKLASHGHGTALTFARTDTIWFARHVWDAATAVLFLAGRLHFYRPDDTRAPANSGGPSCLIAYGEHDATRLSDADLPGTVLHLHHTTSGAHRARAVQARRSRAGREPIPALTGVPTAWQEVLDFGESLP